MRKKQSGQAIVLVAVALMALIGSAALVLLAGSATWQRNQLQQLADSTAIDSALKIATGCNAASASAVITEADTFLATQRTRTGALSIAAGTCATPYRGTDTFAGGLSATYNYPYLAHQQQVEVVLTLTLPISFGGELGATSTTISRRAVAQALPASVPAVSATTLRCKSGQVNISGSVLVSNTITRNGTCALYAHARFDAASGTYSDFGNVAVYSENQAWSAAGTCSAGSNSGSSRAICADGYELTGHARPTCGGRNTSFLSAGDRTINANPCAAGTGPRPVPPQPTTLAPEPNTDPNAIATLVGNGGAPCSPATVYPTIVVSGTTVGRGRGPVPIMDASGFYHFKPSCYGYVDISKLNGNKAVFDHGFYYFNGAGTPGGGGVCLNGAGFLSGRDVTMEFVNSSGIWTTACDGGAQICRRGTCSFGSQPCSKAACPPNAGADPPNNLTWLAAPCSIAPSAVDAASCTGSSWCPAGDRACWNLLIWAPANVSGQFLLDDQNAPSWLLGTVSFPGACSYFATGSSSIAGAISCRSLTIEATAGNAGAVGGDAGINTAVPEALLVE
jgi:hypothetical protein